MNSLTVGVTTDELVSYKNRKAIIPHEERMAIVESIKYVDQVVSQDNMIKWQLGKSISSMLCLWAVIGRVQINGMSLKTIWRRR